MNGTRMAAASAVLLLGLSGCGGQDLGQKAPEPAPDEPSLTPGSRVTDALVDARCAPDATGAWSASGVLRNRTKKQMSYDVIVQLGAADGQPSTAHVKRVRNVPAGKSADFTVAITDDTASTGPCHVQVRSAEADDSD